MAAQSSPGPLGHEHFRLHSARSCRADNAIPHGVNPTFAGSFERIIGFHAADKRS